MATIRLANIHVERGAPRAGGLRGALGRSKRFTIDNLSLTVPHGQTLVILGPSGCGKSTLLRLIAGLDHPDAGAVLFNGKDVAGLKPGERRIGYMFQSYALYPHMTSKQNILSWFFFRRRSEDNSRYADEKFRRTSELLDVEIDYLLDRKPNKLSGGEKQRVALGRCITRDPELFLLDEPFSNLDAKLRTKYRMHLKRLLSEFGITTVYVTHDQQEAVLLGDLIAVMSMQTGDRSNEGRLEQMGPVRELYDNPRSMFVADFLNLHTDVPGISFLPGALFGPGLGAYTVGVRPEDVLLAHGDDTPHLQARVVEALEDYVQHLTVLTLDVQGHTVTAKVRMDEQVRRGQEVGISFRKYHLFDQATGQRDKAPESEAGLIPVAA